MADNVVSLKSFSLGLLAGINMQGHGSIATSLINVHNESYVSAFVTALETFVSQADGWTVELPARGGEDAIAMIARTAPELVPMRHCVLNNAGGIQLRFDYRGADKILDQIPEVRTAFCYAAQEFLRHYYGYI